MLHGHETKACPFLHAQDERQCVWPGRLELTLDGAGGRFVQELTEIFLHANRVKLTRKLAVRRDQVVAEQIDFFSDLAPRGV